MKILICDRDPEYVKALVTYMINCKDGYLPSSFFDDEAFREAMYEEGFLNHFDCMILASPFYELVADAMEESEEMLKKSLIIRLTEERGSAGEKTFYKYQSADTLRRMLSGGSPEQISEERPRDSPLITLVSPVHHELLLPYALVMANVLADQSSVLLVDLEQISIMPGFCGHDFEKNIMDLVYMLESSRDSSDADQAEICIEEFVEYVDGIAVLAGASGPLEINTLSNEQWRGVISMLKAQNYGRVILLFDELHQGFDAAARESAEVVMLCRQGTYFAQSTEAFAGMYERVYGDIPMRQVYLQMSAADIPGGNFRLEELLDGKLNGIVRKQLAIGI